ncbi:uncharacterized protein LOC143251278 [Tachypleus tridentatus]|uniref:uncharacterized protein LOC143251278 n=1 Tax=Tachypleus tridentatus TaxID=6853 RepID=UPI003FD60042
MISQPFSASLSPCQRELSLEKLWNAAKKADEAERDCDESIQFQEKRNLKNRTIFHLFNDCTHSSDGRGRLESPDLAIPKYKRAVFLEPNDSFTYIILKPTVFSENNSSIMLSKGFIFLTAVVTVLSGYAPLPVDDLSEPIPYDTGFNVQDELGTSLSRQESGDGQGNVQGSYGYVDPNGAWREVKYTAGAGGFQASILTNEPGTSNQSPADVQVSAQEPPAGLQPIEVPTVRSKVVLPAYKKVVAAPAAAFSVPVRPALKYSAPASFLKTLRVAGLDNE